MSAQNTRAAEPVPAAAPHLRKPVTIKWWAPLWEANPPTVLAELIKRFHEIHPDIRVELTVIKELQHTYDIAEAFGAGEGAPDVGFFWLPEWSPEMLDLRPFIEADGFDIEIYFPRIFDAWARWGDKIIGLPIGVGANFVLFNKSIYDETGVDHLDWDTSVAEWLELTSRLADPARNIWGADRPRDEPYRAIWMNFGARPISDDGTTVAGHLNSPASTAAFTWLWDLVATGATPTPAQITSLEAEGKGYLDLFVEGRLASVTLNDEDMLRAARAGVDFGVLPEPHVPGNKRYAHIWSHRNGIWKRTKEPEAAWKFLKYLAGEEGQRSLAIFPSIRRIFHEYGDGDAAHMQAFYRILDLPNTYEWLNQHPYRFPVIRGAALEVWNRVMAHAVPRNEIQSALDAAVPVAQRALDEARSALENGRVLPYGG